jgi:hypothetical protein
MDIRSTQPAVLMTSLSLLLLENGLPDLPVALSRGGGSHWQLAWARH